MHNYRCRDKRILRSLETPNRTAGSALVVPPGATVGDKRPAPSSRHVVSHRLTSLPRASAALPCHRRVSIGGIHDRRALTLVWLRSQLRGPASSRRVAGHPAPPDLRPPVARARHPAEEFGGHRGRRVRLKTEHKT